MRPMLTVRRTASRPTALDAAIGFDDNSFSKCLLPCVRVTLRRSKMRSCFAVILTFGNFGMPENESSVERIRKMIPGVVQTALDWGCPYIVYWQLYCNELADRRQPTPVTSNDAVRGFWLIRPDGSKAWTWDYFHGLLNSAGTAQVVGSCCLSKSLDAGAFLNYGAQSIYD